MDAYGILFLLCVAVFAVNCKPASNDAKENRAKLVQTLQDEIDKLNKQVGELKEVYKDAAKKSIDKAMADEKKDSHFEKATVEKVASKDERHYHLPSVEDSLKKAFAEVETIPEAPAMKAEDIPSKMPAPKEPTMVGVKEGNEKKEVPMDDYDDDSAVADYTGIDFDEFLNEAEKKDAAESEKKSMSAQAPHQNGPSHDIVDDEKEAPHDAAWKQVAKKPAPAKTPKKAPAAKKKVATKPAPAKKPKKAPAAKKKVAKKTAPGDKNDKLSDDPSAKELADFFGTQPESGKTSDEGKMSAEEMKAMLTDDEDAGEDAERLDESEEVKRKEIAKQQFDNLSDQLRDVRTDIVDIGKDFGGMRNDYLAKKEHTPLSEDAKSKLRELKDDFKEIISEFKEMANALPKTADEMSDEEHDRADSSKPHYSNDEMEVLVNDMKNELSEVAKKMKVVKDAVMQHDTKKEESAEEKTRAAEKLAEALEASLEAQVKDDTKEKNAEENAGEEKKEALDAEEPRKSDEAKAKMEGLQDELKDIMKEAKGLRAEVLEQRSKKEKRDQETIDKQMQEMRDLRDEVTNVRTEMKSLQDGKQHA